DPAATVTAQRTWRLPDGTVWPVARRLAVPGPVAASAAAAGRVRLTDSEGFALADLVVEGAELDGRSPAEQGAGAADEGRHVVWGTLERLALPVHHDHVTVRTTPADLRARGPWAVLWPDWPSSLGIREEAALHAREHGLPLLHVATLDPARLTAAPTHLAARIARRLQENGEDVALLPVPDMGWEGADVLARAVVAGLCGARVLLLEPRRVPTEDVGARVRDLARSCGVEIVELDGDQPGTASAAAVLGLLDAGRAIPGDLLEPELAAEAAALHRGRMRRGYTVFFTGLSGSGKSTLAAWLVARLLERESRSVTLLDGDEVRLHLSKGLGFSREDRATNVERLGFVAAEVTKAGGVAVCCPIAPEDAVRRSVRRMVEAHGDFVLVHVATPLEECERRDRKGLCAQARAGRIPEFTGISSPYEPPLDAALVLDTTGADIDACVDAVLRHLEAVGVLPAAVA
ncbi:MAG: adenylyl-sulfate kinase, partial [Actinomycetes bacterium]